MITIKTGNAPSAVGPYSQAKISGNRIYTSGQIALSPITNSIEEITIEGQTIQVCENIKAILEEAGSSLNKVIKTTCYLKHMTDFDSFNKVYAQYFITKPARSCIGVAGLPKNALVEIEVIAEK